MIDPLITIVICLCLSLMFAVASIHKLQAVAVFKATLNDYKLLPEPLSGSVAWLLILAEMVSALLVLIPLTRISGLLVMAILLAVYTAGISINLVRGRRDIDCGCSGPTSRHELSEWLVLRNLALLGLLALAANPQLQRTMNWLDITVIVFCVLVASGLYMGMNQLLAQAPRFAALKNGL